MNNLSFTRENNQVVVRGLLDRDHVCTAWQSRQDWLSGSGDVSVDLQGVEKVDSAGLAMLIQVKAELLQQGRELALHNVNTQLRQFAEVSGVTELLSLS